MTTTTEVSAMNKAQIIAELENMAAARLFSGRPWLADRETNSAYHRKLIQMGLLEQVCDKPQTWRNTPLGNELDVDLFSVFMGHWDEWEVPMILKDYQLIDEAEAEAPYAHLGKAEAEALYARLDKDDAESVLIGYVKRAYFDYRKSGKFLH